METRSSRKCKRQSLVDATALLPLDCWVLVADFVCKGDVFWFSAACRTFMLACQRAKKMLRLWTSTIGVSMARVEWALRYNPRSGDWKWCTCEVAAQHGAVDVLAYVMRHRLEFRWGNACEYAVKAGRLDVLKWMRRRRVSIGRRAFYTALCAEHFDIVEWMRDDGCVPPVLLESAYYEAIRVGSIPALDWLWRNGCRVHTGTSAHIAMTAVYYRRIDCLKWMLDHNFPHDPRQLLHAASTVEMATWIRKRFDFPLPITTHVDVKSEDGYHSSDMHSSSGSLNDFVVSDTEDDD